MPRSRPLLGCLLIAWALAISGCGKGAMSQSESDARDALREMGAIIVNDANNVHPATIMLMSAKIKEDLDAAIQHVGELKYLTHVEATDLPITDAHAKTISQLSYINSLVLTGSLITDAGMTDLGSLKKLDTLFINRTAVTDASSKTIGKLSNLKILDASETGIVENLAPLKELPELDWLVLENTEIGAAAMGTIAELPKLNRLTVKGSQIAAADMAALKKAKPQLSIDEDE